MESTAPCSACAEDAELTKRPVPCHVLPSGALLGVGEDEAEIEEGGEKLTVTDADGNKAFAYGDFEPQPARTDPTEELWHRSLAKTGGTPFEAADIAVEMDGGPWFVPGSTVNELRREALDALGLWSVLRPWPTTEEHVPALPQRTLPPHRTLRARFERWDQVPEQALSGVEYLILPIAQADRVLLSGGKTLEPPPGPRSASWKKIPPAASRYAGCRLCRVRGKQHRPPAAVPGPAAVRRFWPEHHKQRSSAVLCGAGTEQPAHPAGGQGQ